MNDHNVVCSTTGDKCIEHSGVMTMLGVHTLTLQLIEKRLFQIGMGVFLCFLGIIASTVITNRSKPPVMIKAAYAQEMNGFHVEPLKEGMKKQWMQRR